MFSMFSWLYHFFLISELNTCPILMFEYLFQSLVSPLQESELKLPLGGLYSTIKWPKRVQKLPTSGIFGHISAILGALEAP